MNKHFFKFVAIVLVVATLFCIPVPVMASETENDIPENATRHTIEITVEPGEEVSDGNTSDGASPYIWGNNSYPNLWANSTTYTPQFNIPDRNFAYETSATTSNGGTLSASYSVSLVRSGNLDIAGMTNSIDGQTYKLDWITISNTSVSDYQFQIINYSTSTIVVTITYYSWA